MRSVNRPLIGFGPVPTRPNDVPTGPVQRSKSKVEPTAGMSKIVRFTHFHPSNLMSPDPIADPGPPVAVGLLRQSVGFSGQAEKR